MHFPTTGEIIALAAEHFPHVSTVRAVLLPNNMAYQLDLVWIDTSRPKPPGAVKSYSETISLEMLDKFSSGWKSLLKDHLFPVIEHELNIEFPDLVL